MDVIMAATGAVRDMFGALERGVQPDAGRPGSAWQRCKAAIAGQLAAARWPRRCAVAAGAVAAAAAGVAGRRPDWNQLCSAP